MGIIGILEFYEECKKVTVLGFGFSGFGAGIMSVGLESPHGGFLTSDSPGSPPPNLAEMISRNKMLEGQ